MQNKCWWCNSPADSREHIFKKSDQKRIYGKPPYTKSLQPLIEYGPGLVHKVQGPDSDAIKFKANLCKNCNNNRSSAFDKSYSIFIEGIQNDFWEIVKTNVIDLRNVYGSNWVVDSINLTKYFIKHICCRLSHDGIIVPQNLIDYLDDLGELNDLRLQFELRPENWAYAMAGNKLNPEIQHYEIQHVGKLIAGQSNGNEYFLSWLTMGWISINYLVEADVSKNKATKYGDDPLLQIFFKPFDISVANSSLSIRDRLTFIEESHRIGDADTVIKFYLRVRNW